MMNLDAVVKEKTTEEIRSRDSQAAFNKMLEQHDFF